jgi:acyl carrier protein
MDPSELEREVCEVVASHLEMDLASVDLDAQVEEIANSLELSTLVIAMERHFGVEFDDSALGRVRILRDVVTLVANAKG